jgi:hypothetical protein
MKRLEVSDLYSLEEYHKIRADFRAKVLEHKRNRQVALGPSATLYFEDRLTMQYQVQEMLRIERIFEEEAIQEELGAYNPLIPDGSNFKATFMIEFPDAEERRRQLQRLGGIEDNVYAQVQGFERVVAYADEDLERSSDEGKTSAVHFLRFELTAEMAGALKQGALLGMGVEHPNYAHRVEAVDEAVRQSLVADLD